MEHGCKLRELREIDMDLERRYKSARSHEASAHLGQALYIAIYTLEPTQRYIKTLDHTLEVLDPTPLEWLREGLEDQKWLRETVMTH